MEITHWVLSAIVLILLYMNLLASVAIWKEDDLNRFQKGAQLGLVWLLPIFGAPTVLYFIFHQSPEVIPVKVSHLAAQITCYESENDHSWFRI